MYNILIVSENGILFNKIEKFNEEHNYKYTFFLTSDQDDIGNFILNHPISLIILSNLNLMTRIKSNSTLANIPIVLWAPCDKLSTEIHALGGGADSYFNQLSSWILLFSQINVLLRKIVIHAPEQQSLMQTFIFFPDRLEVEFHGQIQKLSTKEYIILNTLVNNPGVTYSQRKLNELTSGEHISVSPRSIDTFVNGLRQKIGHKVIISIRNKGYMINENFLLIDQVID